MIDKFIFFFLSLALFVDAVGQPNNLNYSELIANSSIGDSDFSWTLNGTAAEKNGLTTTIFGTVDYTTSIVPSIYGHSWQSNENSYLVPENNELINTTASSSRSISLWFKAISFGGWQNIYEEGDETNGWHIALYDQFLTFNLTQEGNARKSIQYEISENTTYHTVAVFDLKIASGLPNMFFYVNGILIGSTEYTYADMLDMHAGDIQFGGIGDGQANPTDNGSKLPEGFKGQIQQIDYWNEKSLSNNDVTNIYEDGIDGPANAGHIILGLEEREDGTYTITPRLSRPEVLNDNALIIGLGSSTLNGTGASTAFQIRNLFSDWLETNTSGSKFLEVATGGYFTNCFLPDITDDSQIKPHENSTVVSGIDPDIAFIMLPSNDQRNDKNTALEYYDNQLKIKEELEKKGIFVFVQDAQPRDKFNMTEQARLVESANLILSDRSIQIENVIKTFYQLRKEGSVAEIKSIYNSGDDVHLNNAGHQYVHDNLFIPVFQNYFQVNGVSSIELERSLNKNSGYQTINFQASESGETFSRVDNKDYFYRARIKFDDGAYSDYSNIVSIKQPLSIGNIDQTIQLNFTNSSTIVEKWNNWNDNNPSANESIFNLKDTDDITTGVNISILDNGFGIGSGVTEGGNFPNSVIETAWTIQNNDNTPKLKIDGLLNEHVYNFKIISSESSGNPLAKTVAYVIENDKIGGLISGGNTGSQLIKLNGLIPSNGSLTIDLRTLKIENNGIGYINGLIIERRGDLGATPVELQSFYSKKTSYGIELVWSTYTEINNDRFIIEHSTNAINYRALGTKQGRGTISTITHYNFIDHSPMQGDNYYRLTQVDDDGTRKILGVIYEKMIGDVKTTIYPIPIENSLNIIFEDRYIDTNTTIRIFSLSGEELWSTTKWVKSKINEFKLNESLNGRYIMELRNQYTSTSLPLFIK